VNVTPVTRSLRELLRIWLPAVCILTFLIVGMSVLLARSQAQSRSDLEQRYALRTALASRFVTAYITDIQTRETAFATRFLSARVVTDEEFDRVAGVFGFDAGLLLDARGRVLHVMPANPGLVGARLDTVYDHLRAAVAGKVAVSNIVPSAARGLPIVAIAVPFETPFGRRVFSSSVPLVEGPLSAFLADALPYSGARAYLIDAGDQVMVAGGSDELALSSPPAVETSHGAISVAGSEYRFASAPIAGTPWRLLALAPTHQLFAPLAGWQRWVPWVVLAAFGLAAAAALGMLSRLMRQKAELAHLATHDPLTGALNRRTLEREFHRLSAAALRSGQSVGVLAIDLDRFKAVNDGYGHATGDELLRRVAETLSLTLRPSDIVARIGGDEFVVLLADVSAEQAEEVAERVFRVLADSSLPLADGTEIRARCSVGVAIAGQDDVIDSALARADGALYRAKDAGRTSAPATLVC
jgi:diguanylate cyclase (GGDEF)-like protein